MYLFASNGQRTLVVASREVPGDIASDWMARHHKAQINVGKRDKALADLSKEIEVLHTPPT